MKKLQSLVVGLSLCGSVCAQTPKTIQTITSTKQTVMEIIFGKEKNSESIDKETLLLLNFIGGVQDKEITSLFAQYGLDIDDRNIESDTTDLALYKTVQTLQQKYGNPHISFRFPKIINKDRYEASFDPFTNTINIDVGSLPKDSTIDKIQEKLLFLWLSELTHAKQFQQPNVILSIAKTGVTLLGNGFNYHSLYKQSGTGNIEYQAHSEIEPELYQEFITTYASNINSNDICAIANLKHICDLFYLELRILSPKTENLIAAQNNILSTMRTWATLGSKYPEREITMLPSALEEEWRRLALMTALEETVKSIEKTTKEIQEQSKRVEELWKWIEEFQRVNDGEKKDSISASENIKQ